jgi:hypothetical protein
MLLGINRQLSGLQPPAGLLKGKEREHLECHQCGGGQRKVEDRYFKLKIVPYEPALVRWLAE